MAYVGDLYLGYVYWSGLTEVAGNIMSSPWSLAIDVWYFVTVTYSSQSGDVVMRLDDK